MKSGKRTKKGRAKVSSDTDPAIVAPTNNADDILDAWNNAAWKARESWLAKPRLHTAIFEKLLDSNLLIEPPDEAFPSPKIKEAFYRQRKKLIEQIVDIKKRTGWDDQRFEQFAKLAVAFREDPSIEKYLTIREDFPEVDIQIGMSGGIDALFAIEKKCEQYGIHPRLVAGAMDGSEPAIDKLCLVLMDRIVRSRQDRWSWRASTKTRSDFRRDGQLSDRVHARRRELGDEEIRVPASLILLIRHHLGALKGDLHEEFRSRETKLRAAWIAGQQLKSGEPLSINRLVKLTTTVPKSCLFPEPPPRDG